MIVIVDYQAGNIGSIQNMIKKIGHEVIISSDPKIIEKATKLILPGVGAFDYGIAKLRELKLMDILHQKALVERVSTLGICLGAQLMCNSSEEGQLPGLSWISGVVKKFPTNQNGIRYTVPHMGWDVVKISKNSKLFEDVPQPPRFYFVHSYYIKCNDTADVLTENIYSEAYHSAFERDNILGVQYHPEKSHAFGKQLLKNFIEKY
jgi:imidazole glycerol-phosphate synthase subunit HisH